MSSPKREEQELFPPLPLEAWEETKKTLHRFSQVVGKIRLVGASHANHWWHAPLYVTTRGLTTNPIPYHGRTFALDFDFVDHRLVITTSLGEIESFLLEGLSVAQFYQQVFARLAMLGIHVKIVAKSYALTPELPFASDTQHASYDREYVNRFWRILVQCDQIFKEFSGRFTGKTSPVHLFWHSFDLVVTRFSGNKAQAQVGNDPVAKEAYSHEVISFGFWPGDENIRFPAFYSYTWPEPETLTQQPLHPAQASWIKRETGSLALLTYEDMRSSAKPHATLLDFLESAYQAGATIAKWDIKELTTRRESR